MARYYVVKLSERQSKAVFWIGELTAGCAFVFLMIALLCAPYLLGLLPEVDAELMRGAR